MSNKGLKSNTKQLTRSIAGIDVSVNLNKNDANLIMAIPLLSTTGSLPINLGLFYNHQDRGQSTIFGKGMKLNLYKEFEGFDLENYFTVKDATGTIEKFERVGEKYLSLVSKSELIREIRYDEEENEIVSYKIILQDGTQFYYCDPFINYPAQITLHTGEIYNVIFEMNKFRIYNNKGSKVDVTYQNGQAIACGTYFNDVFRNWVGFTFENNHITKIRYHKNSALQNEVIFTYTDTQITILDTLTNHKLVFALNGNMVTCIQEGVDGLEDSFTSTSIEYDTTKTTIIDDNGNETYYHFAYDGTPLYVLDELGNAQEETYNDYGLLTTKSTVVSPVFFERDILKKNLTQFENPNGFMLSLKQSLDSEIQNATGGDVYESQGSGKFTYTLNRNLIQGDSLQLVTWLKYVEMQSDDAFIKIKMSCGDESVERAIYDEMDIYRLVTLGLHLEKSHDDILIEFEIVGLAAFELGGIKLYQRDFGTQCTYDEYMNLTKVQTSKGNTTFEYDENHKLVSLTDTNDNKTEKQEKNVEEGTTSFKGSMNPHGVITLSEFDNESGALVTKITYNPITKQTSVIINDYDENMRLLDIEHDNLGHYTEYGYDYFERVTSTTDQTKNKLSYTYDYSDNLLGLTLNMYQEDGSYIDTRLVTNTFTDSNDLDSSKSANNSEYSFTRDQMGNVTHVHLNNVLLVEFVYDLKGKLIKKLYEKDGYEFEYDVFNQVKKVYYLQNKITKILKYEYVYDILGRVVEIKDGVDNTLEEYQYDIDGNLARYLSEDCVISYSTNSNGYIKKESNILDSKIVITQENSGKIIEETKDEFLTELESSGKYLFGDFSENANIVGKGLVISPCEGESFSLGNSNGLTYLKGESNNRVMYYYPTANDCNKAGIALWFKADNDYNEYIFSLTNGERYSISDVNNGRQSGRVLYARLNNEIINPTIEIGYSDNYYDNQENYILFSNYNVFKPNQWNFVAFNYELTENGLYRYSLFFNGKMHIIDEEVGVHLGKKPMFSLGLHPYAHDKGRNGYDIAYPIIIAEDKFDLDTIISYYNRSKDLLIKQSNERERTQIINTTLFDINSDTNENIEVYPLNGTLNSLSDNKPIKFNKANESQTFMYDCETETSVYNVNGSELIYNTNLNDSGTIMLDVKFNTSFDEQVIWELFDTNNNKFTLFRDENFKIKYQINSSLYDTGLKILNNVWTNIIVTFKNELDSEADDGRVVRILVDDVEYFDELPDITLDNLKLSLGGKSNDNLSNRQNMNGKMKMLVLTNEFQDMEDLFEFRLKFDSYSNTTRYDSFSRPKYRTILHNCKTMISNDYEFEETDIYLNDRVSRIMLELDGKDPSDYLIGSHTGYRYTTNNVKKERIRINNLYRDRTYSYDSLGQVISITDPSFGSHSYEYDERGFLTKEDNTDYQHDSNGNITRKGNITFEYDSVIKDRLNKVGNKIITYSQDNPLLPYHYDGKYFTFEGNKLTSIYQDVNSDTTQEIFFEYDHQGRRISKTKYISYNDDRDLEEYQTNYYYEGNNLITEIKDNLRYDYLYDQNNMLYGFIKNKTDKYFYIRDILMNILGIVDINGNIIVKYNYDAYGNLISTTGNTSFYNPFKYKGYYYDEETQLFYCNSRYYSPELCRWISPDSIEYLDPESINGLNLYCYCYNNPISYSDPSGNLPQWAEWLIGGAVIVGLGIATVFTGGAAGVILGAAFYGAVTSAVGGALVGGIIGGITGGWEGALDGAASGFMWGAISGAVTGALTSGINIATGSVQIVGSAQKTGSLFHQFASNVQAGKMSLAVGRYSEIHLNRSKGLGIKGFRPDVTGVTKNGLRVVEVVSSSQTYASQVAKVGRMMGQYSHISNGLTIDALRFITSWFVF